MAKIYNPSTGSMTVLYNGESFSVDKDHPNYKELLSSFQENDFETFADLTKVANGVKVYIQKDSLGNKTGLELVDDKVYYNGRELHSSLVSRITGMKQEGHQIEYMMAFLENLLKNPSNRAVEELYDFLMNKSLPITEDGCFLAYKSVTSDYLAKYTGCNLTLTQGGVVNNRINNAVGQVIECVRNEVDDERGNECSKGLHVGGLQYSGPNGWYHSYGDKVVIVKVNPADVVSVPKDHNAQKVRVCKYEVVEEYKFDLPDYSTCCGSGCDCDEYEEEDWEDDDELDYVCPEDLEPGDIIGFVYKNEPRVCVVESVGVSTVTCYLAKGDTSYDGERAYRTFSMDEMELVLYY